MIICTCVRVYVCVWTNFRELQLQFMTYITSHHITGTYVFYMSNDRSKTVIISVTALNVECTTPAPFVEASESSLITLGIVSNPSIVLSPDWSLIGGLLGGTCVCACVCVCVCVEGGREGG